MYSGVDEVLVEGVPGAGKSIFLARLAELFYYDAKVRRTHEIWVNGQPYNPNTAPAEERALVVKTGEVPFVRLCYDPVLKHAYPLTRSTIGFDMIRHELAFEKWVSDMLGMSNERSRRMLHLRERSSASSFALFAEPTSWDLAGGGDAGHTACWQDARSVQRIGLGLHADLLKRRERDKFTSTVIWLRCGPRVAINRVRKRGRKFEAEFMKLDYMDQLVKSHENFFLPAPGTEEAPNAGRVYVGGEIHHIDCEKNAATTFATGRAIVEDVIRKNGVFTS